MSIDAKLKELLKGAGLSDAEKKLIRQKLELRKQLNVKISQLAKLKFTGKDKIPARRLVGVIYRKFLTNSSLDWGGKNMTLTQFTKKYRKSSYNVKKQMIGYALSRRRSFDEYMGGTYTTRFRIRDTDRDFVIGMGGGGGPGKTKFDPVSPGKKKKAELEIFSIKDDNITAYEQQLAAADQFWSEWSTTMWNVSILLGTYQRLLETVLRLCRNTFARMKTAETLLMSALTDNKSDEDEELSEEDQWALEQIGDEIGEGLSWQQVITFRGHLQQMQYYQELFQGLSTTNEVFMFGLKNSFEIILWAIDKHVSYMEPRDWQPYEKDESGTPIGETIETIHENWVENLEDVMVNCNTALVEVKNLQKKENLLLIQAAAIAQAKDRSKKGIKVKAQDNIMNWRYTPISFKPHPKIEVTEGGYRYESRDQMILKDTDLERYRSKVKKWAI